MFRIELDSGSALDAIQELVASARNLSPAMHSISEAMLDSIQQAFADEADPVSGEAWDALSFVTLEQRGGDAHPILQRSGHLASSFAQGRSSGTDFAEVGSNVVYALVHQLGAQQGKFGTTARGGPIPWGDIPPRPMAGFSDDLEEAILDIVSRHLVGG